MKTTRYLPIVIVMTLLSCASQKKLVSDAPFELGSLSSQGWTGGTAESGSGHTVKMAIVSMQSKEVSMEQLYFRGKVSDLKLEEGSDGTSYLVAKFTKKQEVKSEKKYPFKLGSDEAVIAYSYQNKTKFYKISGIKEKDPIIYSSRPQN